MTYLEKVEKIDEDEREFVREELAWLARWIRSHKPMNFREVSRYLHQMLDVSV